MPSTVKRVQLDLPEKSMRRLVELKEDTEASSYAEVIKNSLRLYEALIEEAKAGNTFLVRNPRGELKEYVVF